MASKPKDVELIRFQVFCWRTAMDNRLVKVTPEVIAVSLLVSGPNCTTKVLEAMQTDIKKLTEETVKYLKSSFPKRRIRAVAQNMISLSQGSQEIMQIANEVCEIMNDPATGTHHVLMSILKHNQGLSTLFDSHGVTLSRFRTYAQKILSSERSNVGSVNLKNTEKVSEGIFIDKSIQSGVKSNSNEREVITKYCKNLTALASQHKLDPVIGREKEIDRLIITLGRRKKNNAILVGEPGVGKTAIVEGLAQRIIQGNVPSHVKTFQVLQLNLASVVSKTTCRGQFEERMKMILDIFAVNKNYILFIDEMHTLVGAGASIGGLDAANIMKPALASGEVRCIGATTEDEYRKYFKKDGAMDRRFQRVFVDEPSKEDTIKILMGIRPIIELHHGCTIPDETIKNAVELSIRYVVDRHLPDKAIDCLDEACANAVVREDGSGKNVVVLKSDIVGAIAMQTDIPAEIVGVSDLNRAKNISTFLKERVVGQDRAVDEVSSVLLSAYSGIKNPNRPIGCFVFGGPSGSGTTYVAETMASGLFDSDNSFVRLDMSEFSERFGNTKLIGSPPGYVGYGEKNQLTDRVARKQHCLILLDGIENANEDVLKVFTQAMSKGVITDASGNEVSFRNSIIVMTMNFDPTTNRSQLGFENHISNEKDVEREAMTQICRKRFGDDFVNRIDEFIVFAKLEEHDLKRAAIMRLDGLVDRLKSIDIDMSYEDDVQDVIVSNVMNEEKPSIKSIDRFVRRFVESAISIELSESQETVNCLKLGTYMMKITCSACAIAK
jgi:ATP-dependent Clp protease ATP-binding subunit ClpC